MVIHARPSEKIVSAWRILGLHANPTYSEVRAAYRRLAVATHPDRSNEPGTKERFQKLHAAYEEAIENCKHMDISGDCGINGDIDGFDWRAAVARVRTEWRKRYGMEPDAMERPGKRQKEAEGTAKKSREQMSKAPRTGKMATAPLLASKKGAKSPTHSSTERNQKRAKSRRKLASNSHSKHRPDAAPPSGPKVAGGRMHHSTPSLKPPTSKGKSLAAPRNGAAAVGKQKKAAASSGSKSTSASPIREVRKHSQITVNRRRCLLTSNDKVLCRLMASEATRRLLVCTHERRMWRLIGQMIAETRLRCAIMQLEDAAWRSITGQLHHGPGWTHKCHKDICKIATRCTV
uniref:WGS project CAEQ00000000 data, annotated contig 1577 n=1 Tax=Trypanosoma congolense (strain IL3000) TaxID=1068625 RepID=F9W779_TRYCI|nr:unnamed protein product [Trypanosoma congolense IL3000]